MSFAKRMMARYDEQERIATGIAIKAGCLRVCEFHGEAFIGAEDRTPAYMLGNSRFTAGKLTEIFDSRTELSDAIKAAIEDAPDECGWCAKLLAD